MGTSADRGARCFLLAPALVAALAGCSSDDPKATPPSALAALRESYRSAAQGFTLAPPAWEPCPLLTDGPGTEARCADFALPISWLDPDGRTTNVFVKSLPPAGVPKQQIWLLAGGPGGGGNGLDGAAAVLRNGLPDAEFLIIDYRGTGRSGRLTCPDEETVDGNFRVAPSDPAAYAATAARCFAALEATVPAGDLRLMNTTETAMDLGMLAGALAAPGASLGIFGISFGTYVAHRYLHLFPEQPTAVVLDSMVPPNGATHRDEDVDQVARRILGHCAENPDCGPRLGDDPEAFAASLVERLGQGHCPSLASAGISVARFLSLAGQAVLTTQDRSLLPALYFRANRCEPADVAALVKYGTRPAPASTSAPYSEPLMLLVSRSELLERNLRDAATPLIAAADSWGTPWTRAMWDVVPAYPRDAFWGEWARTDASVLILASELDANTPAGNGEAARDRIVAPHVEFVSLPHAGHVAFVNFDCGWPMIDDFFHDPAGTVDTSCTSTLTPPSFVVTPDQATARFGEADLWANTTP